MVAETGFDASTIRFEMLTWYSLRLQQVTVKLCLKIFPLLIIGLFVFQNSQSLQELYIGNNQLSNIREIFNLKVPVSKEMFRVIGLHSPFGHCVTWNHFHV